jgi:hypothetical protein
VVVEYSLWGAEGGAGDGEFSPSLLLLVGKRGGLGLMWIVMLTVKCRCKCRLRLASSAMCCAETTRLR